MLIEWPDVISEDYLFEILTLQQKLEMISIPGVKEVYPAYRSLAVHYDQDKISFDELEQEVGSVKISGVRNKESKIWVVPVCYEPKLAPDMENFCIQKNMSPDEVIQLHTGQNYLVHFMGFLPGFMYLGNLKKELFLDRKTTPDAKIPKGAVAIGGSQTGIYPMESPGGWHVIGNSPLDFFNPLVEPPCFIEPGDQVRFKSISLQDWKVIRLEVELEVFDIQTMLSNA